MSSTVARVIAGVGTGGLSEAALAAGKATGSSAVTAALNPVAGALEAASSLTKPPTMPAAGAGPQAPSLTDAAKQAALDEQKRAANTGPGTITNTGGAMGILTDPNAKYAKSQLLGGA